MADQDPIVVFWFRRDLRLDDNHGLWKALQSGLRVLPVFVFDTEILHTLPHRADRRVAFIHKALSNLNQKLQLNGSTLWVGIGKPIEIFEEIVNQFDVKAVYCNHDYEPYALNRDASIARFLNVRGIGFFHFKDHVIFENQEITKPDGGCYTVFTPYSKAWKKQYSSIPLSSFPSETLIGQFFPHLFAFPSLESIGFEPTESPDVEYTIDEVLIRNYHLTRNLPSVQGTSLIGIHLRFGTLSIRKVVALAANSNESWLNELIWREFFMMIMVNFPHSLSKGFRAKYEFLPWANPAEHFERWCEGTTGFPMVDAGMRELNATGFMHNRVRMVVASFLSKHLLIDWRWGEQYFAEKLLDFELASNNGNWQWAAGTGCDAAPYFRVFNPYEQAAKFDPKNKYISHWIPEYGSAQYPAPIVDHAWARARALAFYQSAQA